MCVRLQAINKSYDFNWSLIFIKSEGLNHNEESLISSYLLKLSFVLMPLGQNINLSTSPTDLCCLMSLKIIVMPPPHQKPQSSYYKPPHYLIIYSSSPPPSPFPAHNPATWQDVYYKWANRGHTKSTIFPPHAPRVDYVSVILEEVAVDPSYGSE